jgi:hypothetical protein
VPEVRRLLAASHVALPAGGLIVIHDALINADKSGPLPVAEYSAMLMHSTEGKCYSVSELEGFLLTCGFVSIQHRANAADRSVMTAMKP